MDWLPDIETGALALAMMQLGKGGGAMAATAAGG